MDSIKRQVYPCVLGAPLILMKHHNTLQASRSTLAGPCVQNLMCFPFSSQCPSFFHLLWEDCTPDSSPDVVFLNLASKGSVVVTGSFGKLNSQNGPKCVSEHWIVIKHDMVAVKYLLILLYIFKISHLFAKIVVLCLEKEGSCTVQTEGIVCRYVVCFFRGEKQLGWFFVWEWFLLRQQYPSHSAKIKGWEL